MPVAKLRAVVAIVALGVIAAPVTLVAEDDRIKARIKSGRAKAQGCTRCHGRDGIRHLAVANGFEQNVGEFVIVTLTELRNGSRHHNVMSDIAAPLSDEDIGDIGAWAQSVADKSVKN